MARTPIVTPAAGETPWTAKGQQLFNEHEALFGSGGIADAADRSQIRANLDVYSRAQSDVRPPANHAASHGPGAADAITLDAAQTTTGVFARARLATGTANATTFVCGDGTYKVPSSGSGAFPMVSVKDYGAIGNGTANDTAAFTSALSAVAARTYGESGGRVYVPPGNYMVDPLLIPKNIALVGESPYSTVLLNRSSTVATAFLTFGTAGEIDTYCGIDGIRVDSQSMAKTGILLYGPQEGSMVRQAMVIGSIEVGIDAVGTDIVGGSNKFVVSGSWVMVSGATAIAGIRVTGGPVTLRDTTFVNDPNPGYAAGSAGVSVIDGQAFLQNVNCEQFESGYRVTRSHFVGISIQAWSVTYSLTTTADTNQHVVQVLGAYWDASTCNINDVGAGVTNVWAQTYSNGADASNVRELYKNRHAWKTQGIYDSDTRRAVLGYTSPANADTANFKVSALVASGWTQPLFVDNADGSAGVGSSAWNGTHLRMGTYRLWIDASGRLRVKNGKPTSDTDGTIVGTQA